MPTSRNGWRTRAASRSRSRCSTSGTATVGPTGRLPTTVRAPHIPTTTLRRRPDMPAERLQKVLAAAGVASRRGSEALIAAGRVTVDGRVARVGDQADPDRSIIAVDGRVIGAAAQAAYLLLHKPAGVTST